MRLLLLLLLFVSATAAAQPVAGTVRDAAGGGLLAGVRVVNLTTGASTFTGEDGSFSLSGAPGDPVSFGAAGYSSTTKKVPAGLGTVPWRVTLTLFNVSLQEVLIRPKLHGYSADSAERRAVYSRVLSRRRSSVMSPASFIAERLSRQQRALFKFQKDFERMEDEKFVDSRYSPELVAQLTALSGDTLAQFLRENPMPLDYARAATDLELKMWIRSQYKAWAAKSGMPVNRPMAQDSTAVSSRQ